MNKSLKSKTEDSSPAKGAEIWLSKIIKKLRQVFDMYDDNHDGVLETITAGKMLMDLYRAMNKEFMPTATDIASFARIFDRENKGKITTDDMERFIVKYYCNED